MKKKLLVILGAGSSIACGMPSVSDLDELIKRWAQEWKDHYGFPDYFEALWHSVKQYYNSGVHRLHPPLNFEKVLGEMLSLGHWVAPAPWGDPLRQVLCNGAPRMTFRYPIGYGPTVEVMAQLSYLLGKLARHVRVLCKGLASKSDGARQYQTLITSLRDAFDVGIYNLNYDTAALTAWPEAYTGFSERGEFEPHVVHEQKRSEWGFLYHLHGSVHHSLVGHFGSQICWRRDLADTDNFMDTRENGYGDKRSEGKSFPITTLIAGGFKLDQMLIEPFHSLHAAMVRHIYAADAILIGGYGFADVHVNRALHNRLRVVGARPVMVLDRACRNTDPMAFRHDLWANELSLALNASSSFFFEPGHSSPPVPFELGSTGSFEVSGLHHVALWHGGFLEAARRIDAIVSWLNGGPDEILLPSSC